MNAKKLLALGLALLLVLAAFCGCAASPKAMMDTAASTPYAMQYTSSAKAEESGLTEDAYPAEEPAEALESEELNTSGFDSGSGGIDYDQALADYTAKIIYSASISAQTTEFDKAVASLEKMVADYKGFIQNSNISGNTCYNDDGTTTVVDRWAYYTVRIPAAKFESFLQQADGLGNVTQTTRNAENVTSAYTDYEARLSALNTQEERLLSMLEKSEDVESLIALEQRLSDVRYEIESIERNLRNLDQQISYSTVSIELQEVEVYTPTVPVQRSFGEKLSSAFSDGWRGFTRGLQRLALNLAEALPTLVLVAVLFLAAFLIVRASVRKSRAKRAAKKEASAPQPEQKPET